MFLSLSRKVEEPTKKIKKIRKKLKNDLQLCCNIFKSFGQNREGEGGGAFSCTYKNHKIYVIQYICQLGTLLLSSHQFSIRCRPTFYFTHRVHHSATATTIVI